MAKKHIAVRAVRAAHKSSLCLHSADGLDGDFIDIIGGGDGGRHKERMSDKMVDLEAERDLALLRAVKQLVLLNGPFDLCSLQAHLHARGLDSQILRWIFRGNFEHYSPTRRVHELVERISLVGNSQGGGRNLSWEDFPAVAILSCMKDKSIPVDQARGLHRALASAKIVNGENTSSAVGVCLVEYANFSHTSLVVEGPLEGDPTIFRDLDALMRLVDSKGKLALSSFTSFSLHPENMTNKQKPLYTPMVTPCLLVWRGGSTLLTSRNVVGCLDLENELFVKPTR